MTRPDTDAGTPRLRRGHQQVRETYRDERVAVEYLDRRFARPVGALLHRRQLAALRGAVERLRPRRVLELAPGPARLTADLAPYLRGVGVALEASAPMLAEARGRLRNATNGSAWRLVQGDAFALPLRRDFQLVYSFRFIRHFERSDRLRLYDSVLRSLQPGGLFLFDAVNEVVSAPLRAEGPPGRFTVFDALFQRQELVQELHQAGFQGIQLTGVQHRFRAQRAAQNLLAPRSRWIAAAVVSLLDQLGGEPLEWIVTCRPG